MSADKHTLQCPSCHAVHRVPERLAGRQFKCKQCGAIMRDASPEFDVKPTAQDVVTPEVLVVCEHCGQTATVDLRQGTTFQCPHCLRASAINPPASGPTVAPSERRAQERAAERPFLNRKVSPVVAAVFILVPILIFLGNFHIVRGSAIGWRLIPRMSFGFREMIVDVDEITGMPHIVATSRYPLGCKVLQREGIIESEDQMKDRVREDLEREMEDAKRKVERDMRRLMAE